MRTTEQAPPSSHLYCHAHQPAAGKQTAPRPGRWPPLGSDAPHPRWSVRGAERPGCVLAVRHAAFFESVKGSWLV